MRRGSVLVIAAGAMPALMVFAGCGPMPSPPPPTVTPTPAPVTVRVELDGKGDYTTLEEAVQRVSAGSRMELGPGIHRVESPLRVDKAVYLEGVGKDGTQVVGQNLDHLVLFVGDGRFLIKGITFRNEGRGGAIVVVVEGGEVGIATSRFMGGKEA